MYIGKLNVKNKERYQKEKKLLKHYRITGAILISIALSVYAYTMYAIRQEKFLDDFDEPELPDKAALEAAREAAERVASNPRPLK
jgi:hypothetical protein